MSRSRTEVVEAIPPLLFPRGRQEVAVLSEQEVPEYRGNPLIEALPPIWTRAEVTEKLAHFPHYSEEQRQWPDHLRLRLIENAREFFIPQGIHLEVEIRVSCMLRRGYRQRNPLARGHWPAINSQIETLRLKPPGKVFLPAKARGFAVVGPSGVGKSTTLENILSLYPQVILHSQYGDQPLILKQLVWLKLDCPKDGSIKGLCLNFFQAVDDILGTNYYERYTNSRRLIREMLDDLRAGGQRSPHTISDLVEPPTDDFDVNSGGMAIVSSYQQTRQKTDALPALDKDDLRNAGASLARQIRPVLQPMEEEPGDRMVSQPLS